MKKADKKLETITSKETAKYHTAAANPQCTHTLHHTNSLACSQFLLHKSYLKYS